MLLRTGFEPTAEGPLVFRVGVRRGARLSTACRHPAGVTAVRFVPARAGIASMSWAGLGEDGVEKAEAVKKTMVARNLLPASWLASSRSWDRRDG